MALRHPQEPVVHTHRDRFKFHAGPAVALALGGQHSLALVQQSNFQQGIAGTDELDSTSAFGPYQLYSWGMGDYGCLGLCHLSTYNSPEGKCTDVPFFAPGLRIEHQMFGQNDANTDAMDISVHEPFSVIMRDSCTQGCVNCC